MYSNYFTSPYSLPFILFFKIGQADLIFYALSVSFYLIKDEPNSYFDDINSPNDNKWLDAMHD